MTAAALELANTKEQQEAGRGQEHAALNVFEVKVSHGRCTSTVGNHSMISKKRQSKKCVNNSVGCVHDDNNADG